MSTADEINDYGGLMADIGTIAAWRGMLPIITRYSKAKPSAAKVSILLEAVLFAMDRLEGEKDGALREMITLLDRALHESPAAQALADRIYHL